MKIPVGPIHPALEEPLHFTFTVDGERIIGVDFRLGYNHRGIEKLIETKDFNQINYLNRAHLRHMLIHAQLLLCAGCREGGKR